MVIHTDCTLTCIRHFNFHFSQLCKTVITDRVEHAVISAMFSVTLPGNRRLSEVNELKFSKFVNYVMFKNLSRRS